MECFRLLFDHLAWIEFLSGIRDSKKAGSLWGMMRGLGGVRNSEHQSWLAKGLGLGLLCWGFKGVQEEIPSERPALFKSSQRHFHQDNAPVHNSILVTDYLTKRCLWCNGYRHRIWTRRYEFNSWTRLIAFHIALIPLGKVWIQLFSLQLWVNSRAD